jgi:3-hydroxyisobutyrate dehydrogenase-like beta-hydroxyacid dehydrogenase
MPMKIGLVGLGLMGQAMSISLSKAGFELFGYDILPEQMNLAEVKGVKCLDSPREVARKTDVLISSLPTSEIVEEVHCGTNGTCEGASKRQVLVDTSTISPEAARRIAERLASQGFPFLDAPIGGTSGMVARGDCIIMAGGDKDALERCLPALNAIAKQVFHIGPSGAGAQMKLINNHLVATMTASIAEAFVLAMKAGIEPEKILKVFLPSAVTSKMLEVRGPMMVANRYEPHMKATLFLKDLRLILENGQNLGAPLPLASVAQQMMTASVSMGYGLEDVAAVLKVYEKLAGVVR